MGRSDESRMEFQCRPRALPGEAVRQAARKVARLARLRACGVMEMSHRGKEFTSVIAAGRGRFGLARHFQQYPVLSARGLRNSPRIFR